MKEFKTYICELPFFEEMEIFVPINLQNQDAYYNIISKTKGIILEFNYRGFQELIKRGYIKEINDTEIKWSNRDMIEFCRLYENERNLPLTAMQILKKFTILKEKERNEKNS